MGPWEVGMAVAIDARIQQDVRDEIRHDARIDSTNVTVDVSDGVVDLRGTVPTYFQKITAGSDAQRIKGVRDVRNDLVVTLVAPWTDAEIANTVRANLARDVRIQSPSQIDASVTNGVVRLSGTVGTYSQKSAAEDDAWTTPGAVDVTNAIVVTSPVPRDDDAIAKDVHAALNADPALDARQVTARVISGTVYLQGAVPTYHQLRLAADTTWGVVGVLNVVNELDVSL
jgi:osmotically-inducible protein OsmY